MRPPCRRTDAGSIFASAALARSIASAAPSANCAPVSRYCATTGTSRAGWASTEPRSRSAWANERAAAAKLSAAPAMSPTFNWSRPARARRLPCSIGARADTAEMARPASAAASATPVPPSTHHTRRRTRGGRREAPTNSTAPSTVHASSAENPWNTRCSTWAKT